MTTHQKESFDRQWITATFTDLIIRFCVLAIFVYLSLVLVRPFITIVIWSAVLAVALYPAFDWLALRLGKRRRLAAFLITIVSLLIVIGPTAWLALDLIESLRSLSERLDPSLISLPAPPEAVKGWPLIGDQIYQSWHLASINTKAVLVNLAPHLKPLGNTLLRIAADGGAGALQFLISIIVAGFLFCPGPSIVKSVKLFSRRLAPDRAEGFVDLAGATIRAVSQGVIGVSVLQALLAGLGLTVVGVPGASLITLSGLNSRNCADWPIGCHHPSHYLELGNNGDDDSIVFYGLYGAGKFARQCFKAVRYDPRIAHAYAGNCDRSYRRYFKLRNYRTFPWPNCFNCYLGTYCLVDSGGRSLISPQSTVSLSNYPKPKIGRVSA